MIIIGCDFHPSFQQIAMLDTETGATEEHKLMHTSGEAESFYRKLASPAVVGTVSAGSFIEGSLKCILVSASETDRLSRRPRTQ